MAKEDKEKKEKKKEEGEKEWNQERAQGLFQKLENWLESQEPEQGQKGHNL